MVKLFGHEWEKAELLQRVGRIDQIAGIRPVELLDAKGRGSRVFDVWTGSGLRFQVNAERSLDISACETKGTPLSWRSPAGDVHPAYYEPSGIGWLRSFAGGLFVTCGLNQYGSPCQVSGEELGLHGRISNSPAENICARTSWLNDEYILEISGKVKQALLFGENLTLERIISTKMGSNEIKIEDKVTNEGFEPTPHMILYHFNLGFPLVSKKTKLIVNSSEILPRDDNARQGLSHWSDFQLPTKGYQEQVFIHSPVPDENGNSKIELIEPEIGLGVRWLFSSKELPYFMEWKMMGQGSYVIGIEPSNCKGLAGQKLSGDMNLLPILSPGESRHYQIIFDTYTL
jgi:hypothetical protein